MQEPRLRAARNDLDCGSPRKVAPPGAGLDRCEVPPCRISDARDANQSYFRLFQIEICGRRRQESGLRALLQPDGAPPWPVSIHERRRCKFLGNCRGAGSRSKDASASVARFWSRAGKPTRKSSDFPPAIGLGRRRKNAPFGIPHSPSWLQNVLSTAATPLGKLTVLVSRGKRQTGISILKQIPRNCTPVRASRGRQDCP